MGLLSSVPKAFREGVRGASAARAYKGYERLAKERGLDSIVMWLPRKVADKILGQKRTEKLLWKHLSEPALRADTAVGNRLRKIPGGKSLFSIKEDLPMNSRGLKQEVERSSALAPLTKVKDFAVPIIVGSGLVSGTQKAVSLGSGQKKEAMKKELLEKVATTMRRIHKENLEHRKQARAINILFKQAELGIESFPCTYGEFQEKLGMLLDENLDVYEKAMEIKVGNAGFGSVALHQSQAPRNASEEFLASILEDF